MLEDYVTAVKEQLATQLPGFQILSVDDATLSSQPAKKIVYSATVAGISLKMMQVIALKGDKLYEISFVAKESQYDSDSSTVDKMANSFVMK